MNENQRKEHDMEMKKYIVSTHLGDFPTTAQSPERAIANIRFRIFRRAPGAKRYVAGWTVREEQQPTKGE